MNEKIEMGGGAPPAAPAGHFEGSPAPQPLVALGAVALYFVAQLMVSLVLIVASVAIKGQPLSEPSSLMGLAQNGLLNGAVVLISTLISLPIIYAAVVRAGKRPFGELVRLRPPAHLPIWAGAVIALAAGAALDGLTLALGRPLVPPTLRQLYQGPLAGVLVLSVAVIVAAPIMEEILFRGLLYTALADRAGIIVGVAVTTLSFGAIHVCTYGPDWYSVLQALVMGFVLTLMRAWSRSLWPSTVAHVTSNLYSTIEILILLKLR